MKVDFYRTISTIVEADVSASAKAVMVCLLNYRNSKTGLCFPSLTTIADGSGLKPTAVKKAISDLKESGLIEWESKVPKRSNAKVNHYNLLFIWSYNGHMNDYMNDHMGDRLGNQSGDRSESDHEPTGTNKNQKEPIPPEKSGGDKDPLEKISTEVIEFVKTFNGYIDAKFGKSAPRRTDKSFVADCNTIRLAMSTDKFSLDDIKSSLRWAHGDSFWQDQIKSLAQIRRKGQDGTSKLQKIYDRSKQQVGVQPQMSFQQAVRGERCKEIG